MHADSRIPAARPWAVSALRPAALVAIGILGLVGGPGAGAAEPTGTVGPAAPPAELGPLDVVRKTTDRLLAAIEHDREGYANDPERVYRLVDEVASPYVDYERISARTLGAHWRRATASQRARIEPAIRVLLVRSLSSAVTGYAGTSIRYLPVRFSRGMVRALVRTRVPQNAGQTLSLDFRLHRKDGQWKIYDVIAGGVSLVLTYRSTFVAEAKRVGIEAFIDRLARENRPPARGS